MACDETIRTTAPPGLSLRRVVDADLPFLAELYASTRREEVAQVPWTEEQREAFLHWQFDSQHRHYRQYYPNCEFLLIEKEGQPIGRIYVDRWKDQIRLVDIALLPEHRGGGLGTSLLSGLLDEGRERGLPVTIHVEHNNPTLRLYRRLGFRLLEDRGVYHLMEWMPPDTAARGGTSS
ncbi:MAG: GNAT family N-acetyltransferase [Thermoanaerobaculia bacterium]